MTAETQWAVLKQVLLHRNEHIAGSGRVAAQVWGECIDDLLALTCAPGRAALRQLQVQFGRQVRDGGVTELSDGMRPRTCWHPAESEKGPAVTDAIGVSALAQIVS